LSQLFNRPSQIYDIVTSPPAPEFSPAPLPTFADALDIPSNPEDVPAYLHRYQVLHGARFWWASLPHLPPDQRPVDLARTGLVLGAVAAVGLGLMAVGLRAGRREE
jgi:hypothetical protein